jgi:hypothetical protein
MLVRAAFVAEIVENPSANALSALPRFEPAARPQPPESAGIHTKLLILIGSIAVAAMQRNALILPARGETFRARLGLV